MTPPDSEQQNLILKGLAVLFGGGWLRLAYKAHRTVKEDRRADNKIDTIDGGWKTAIDGLNAQLEFLNRALIEQARQHSQHHADWCEQMKMRQAQVESMREQIRALTDALAACQAEHAAKNKELRELRLMAGRRKSDQEGAPR